MASTGPCKVSGCSKSPAMRMKKSGSPDEAIIKAGKKTIIYADKALDVLSNIINNEK